MLYLINLKIKLIILKEKRKKKNNNTNKISEDKNIGMIIVFGFRII